MIQLVDVARPVGGALLVGGGSSGSGRASSGGMSTISGRGGPRVRRAGDGASGGECVGVSGGWRM
jgi:hypothetical protein